MFLFVCMFVHMHVCVYVCVCVEEVEEVMHVPGAALHWT